MSGMFRLRGFRPTLILFFIFAIAGTARSTTIKGIPSDDDLIVGSRAIIRGKVTGVSCGFDGQHNMVFTYVTVRVREVFKGNIVPGDIVLKEPGGDYGQWSSRLFGTPSFTAGEHVLLYLDTWPDGSLRVHDIFLGKFSITEDPKTGKSRVERNLNYENVELLPANSPAVQSPNASTTSSMELEPYLKLVRSRVKATAKRSLDFENQYYSRVSLLSQPPEYTSVAAAGGLQPQFHLFTNPAVRWFEPDSSQPINFVVDAEQQGGLNMVADANAATSAWANATGTSIKFTNAGSITGCAQTDGELLIDSNDCGGFFSPEPGCSLVVGMGGWQRADRSQTVTVNGVTFIRLLQSYADINPYGTCALSDCETAEVLTHEVGHAIGFLHSWDPNPAYGGGTPSPTSDESAATMFYIAHFDGRCGSIKSDDLLAVQFEYPGSGSGGGGTGGGGGGTGGGTTPLSVTTSSLARGTVGTAYSVALAATGGTAPYTWSLGSSSGPLPAGLTLSAAGLIAGTPTASDSYSFTVQVVDSASNTASADLFIVVDGAGTTSGGYNAQFVSQSVPTSLSPGQAFNASITWKNTGSASWTGGNNVQMGAQKPLNNTIWGMSRLGFLQSVSIPPQTTVQMSFNLTAPSTPGYYDFQWQMVQDSGAGYFGDKSADVVIVVGNPGLSITTAVLQSAQFGAQFSDQLVASGGKQPYIWSVVSGSLPGGLALDPSTGMLSGVPASAGAFTFTIEVTDSLANSVSKPLSLNIIPPALSISVPNIPVAIQGNLFQQQLTPIGGVAPFNWFLASGQLPAGISLAPATGVLSGTPTATGTFNFSVLVTDSVSTQASASLHIQVVSPNSVPSVTSAKYKPAGQKLKVNGQHFDPAAAVTVDGSAVTLKGTTPTLIVVKGLQLTSGSHIVTVTNPNGLSSSASVSVN